MLLWFAVENYLSFKERTVLDMRSSAAVKELPNNTITAKRIGKGGKEHDENCLRSVALIGANASGKSNMLSALLNASNFITSMRSQNLRWQDDSEQLNCPFLLDIDTRSKSCSFEFCLLLNKLRYLYSFSIYGKKVQKEELLLADKGRERLVFSRIANEKEGSVYKFGDDFNKFKIIAEDQDMVRDSALLLSVADRFNVMEAAVVVEFLNGLSSIRDSVYHRSTIETHQNSLTKLMKLADIGIHKLVIFEEEERGLRRFLEQNQEKMEKSEVDSLQKRLDRKVKRLHCFYKDMVGEDVDIPFSAQSDGTKKFLRLFSQILENYSQSTVLLCDEIEQNLHPTLCEAFFDLFHNMPGNKAQLIFTTHNTTLLTSDIFRRDQIYITEKDQFGSSKLVGLDEYTGVRKGASYGKQYLDGRFGGVPIINQRFKRELYKELEAMLKRKENAGEKANG